MKGCLKYLVILVFFCIAGNQSGSSELCEMCSKEKSEWKCVQCKAFLCEGCKMMHLKFGLGKGHTAVKADEVQSSIDKLVFCYKHPDQPIILNCRDCEEPLCIKCKVTKHEAHKTETVEDALERLLPEMEGYCKKVQLLITDIDENKEELEMREVEVRAAFEKCRKDGEIQLQKIIDRATEDYNALTKELEIQEEEELDKLKIRRKQEYEGLVEWKMICNESGKGETLIEQIQSGLGKRLKYLASLQTIQNSTTRLRLPQLVIAEEDQPINVIGKLEFKSHKVLGQQKQISRFQEVPFKEIFKNGLVKTAELELSGTCYRMSMIQGEIWAAIRSGNCIQVIGTDGTVKNAIQCEFKPCAVEEAMCGDIVVASDTGLHVILPNGTIKSTISQDHFTGLTLYGDNMYAINRSHVILQRFSKLDEWQHVGDVEGSEQTGAHTDDTVLANETGAIFTIYNIDSSQYYFYDKDTKSITKYKSCKESLSYPFLCTTDSTGAVLVANYRKTFQVHETGDEWSLFRIDCLTGKYPYDFIYDEQTDAMWILTNYQSLQKLEKLQS